MLASNSKTDIIVIGGGISGIYAAYLLKNKGFNVKLIEASERLLGRIYTLDDFCEFPIELGAEFVHGKKSWLFEYISQRGQLLKTDYSKYYLYKNTLQSLKKIQDKRRVKEFLDFWADLWKYKGEEITLRDYLKSKNLYTRYLCSIIEAFASEYGTTSDKLGLRTLAREEKQWSSGEKNYWVLQSYSSFFQQLIETLKEDIILRTPINFISYLGDKVLLGSKNDIYFHADKVILTVPLAILKKEMIQFEPSLSISKQKAIKKIGVDVGMKVILKFKQKFWKNRHIEIFGGHLCSLYYTPRGIDTVFIAYLMGEKATFLSGFSDEDIVKLLVKDLEGIFFTSLELEKSYVMNWARVPYIEGIYSFSGLDAFEERAILAQPIDDKIYFAGEATNLKGHAATVHGAIETGERVVQEIQDSAKII